MNEKYRAVLKKLLLLMYKPFAPILRLFGVDSKQIYELIYWRSAMCREGTLANSFYRDIYTTWADIDRVFYSNKRVLDIGCGPRGSLEWLNDALERVGLDPLVSKYRQLGIGQHKMTYIDASAENMPFENAHFDIITSINSLDHVDDIEQTIREIKRVVKTNGSFVVLVDIHPQPTIAEPVVLDWSLAKKFAPEFKVIEELHLEHDPNARGSAMALKARIPYDHRNQLARYGAFFARFVRLPDT